MGAISCVALEDAFGVDWPTATAGVVIEFVAGFAAVAVVGGGVANPLGADWA
jgi:hypothetical protein